MNSNLVLNAQALGNRLPPLLVAAERVAATVAQGVHGRRRVGQGDSFWQYRPYQSGDSPDRIDWRQSAKSARTYVRETEWEAAQSVYLWRDGSPSMRWRSDTSLTEKAERAELLLLALAALLLRGGERVRLLGQATVSSLEAMAMGLANTAGLPVNAAVPTHARIVLIGDFLSPLKDISAMVTQFAGLPVAGHILQILDPAEVALPYSGRVRFRGLEADGEMLIPQVEGIRSAYADALAVQQNGLATICRAAGWGISIHHTDQPPEAALLALYMALSNQVPGSRA